MSIATSNRVAAAVTAAYLRDISRRPAPGPSHLAGRRTVPGVGAERAARPVSRRRSSRTA